MIDNSLLDPALIRESVAALATSDPQEPNVKLAHLLGIAQTRPLTSEEAGRGMRLIAALRQAAP